MPTNFQVSTHPALRCVNGDPYALPSGDGASAFFTRLKVTERLVINNAPRDYGWRIPGVTLDLRVGFKKESAHA